MDELTKRRRVLRRQQESAYDEEDYGEIEGRIEAVSTRLRSPKSGKELATRLGRVAALSANVTPPLATIDRGAGGRVSASASLCRSICPSLDNRG